MGGGGAVASGEERRGVTRGARGLRRPAPGGRPPGERRAVTVSTETSSPVEIGVALETPLRLVLAFGHRDSSRRAVARIALASCAEVRGVVPADDARSFVELAQNLRDAKPNAVLVCAADSKDIGSLNVMLEALRLGCAPQPPPPRVLALGPEGIVGRLRPGAGPFGPRRVGGGAPPGPGVRRPPPGG